MEAYGMTSVGAVLKALCNDVQRFGQADGSWCMYTAETAAFAPDTPCYLADSPCMGDMGLVLLPQEAVRQGMSVYITDTLLCDVVSEVLSYRNQVDEKTLVDTLNYYLEYDLFPPQNGKTLHQLDEILCGYQSEYGLQVLRGILMEPACDLSLALEIFYRVGGFDFLEDNRKALDTEALVLLNTLYHQIATGKYRSAMRHYEIPLTKIQRYKLEHRQIPAVFLTDL